MDDDNLSKIELQTNQDTQKHIDKVRELIKIVCDILYERGIQHDKTKLEKPEVEYFAKHRHKLAELTYESKEYKKCLEELKPALDCHFAKNDHHPEFYPDGVNDMTLFSIIEMVCDWVASTLRQDDGNILKGVDKAIERFKIEPQLAKVIENTIILLISK